MNSFIRAHDQYLTPPEEPEAVLCDDCGEEVEVKKHWNGMSFTKCTNQFCPGKFEGDAREMAELLIGAREEVKSLARKLKRLQRDVKEAALTA